MSKNSWRKPGELPEGAIERGEVRSELHPVPEEKWAYRIKAAGVDHAVFFSPLI
jgi:hypothetical protein